VVINYLIKYKLRTIKAKSFEKWVEVYNYRKSRKDKKGLKYEDLEYIKNKGNLINV
jgi:hypothetical protein